MPRPFPAPPKLPRKKPWERGFLLTELFNIYKCTFSYSLCQIPRKRGKNRQVEWWEQRRITIPEPVYGEESSSGSDLEKIEAETVLKKTHR